MLPLMMAAAGGLIAGGGAVALAAPQPSADKAAVEQIVRDYILNNPEIIPEAMQRLQAREMAKAIGTHRPALETPFEGAWAGHEKGDVTLVMFSDYACGYCRRAAPDVDRLLAEDKKLKVVFRELPILGPESETAARAALNAARQGRYLDFHRRMFAERSTSGDSVAAVSKASGVSGHTATDGAVDQEIANNIAMARALGMTGTPTFIVGDQILQGAVGYEALKKAVADARSGV